MSNQYEHAKIALVGSGLIGCGWAIHLLNHGIRNITLFDPSEAALSRAKELVEDGLTFLTENGIITAEQHAELAACPHYTTDMAEAVSEADFILENGPEKLDIKRSILAQIESFCRPDAVITSSTSGIMISEIARDAVHPERVIGAHPYHPVYLLPLVEIVISEKVGQDYLDQAMDFLRTINKKPVILRKNSTAYIGSRLMAALFRESVSLVMNGVCSIEDLDTAFTFGPGLRYALMGPYLVYQLTGGDKGINGFLNGPIGKTVENAIGDLCNWDHWPEEAREFFDNQCISSVTQIMSEREPGCGRDNQELCQFRDRGLLEILKFHKLI